MIITLILSVLCKPDIEEHFLDFSCTCEQQNPLSELMCFSKKIEHVLNVNERMIVIYKNKSYSNCWDSTNDK